MSTYKYDISLVILAIVWGTGFVATRFIFDLGVTAEFAVAARMGVAALVIALFMFKKLKGLNKTDLKFGLIIGLFLFLGFMLQNKGLEYTSVSNNAFLMSTNLLMVPFLSWLLLKKRPSVKSFIAIAIGFAGTVVLTGVYSGNLSFNIGDAMTLLSAVCYAGQIAYSEVALKHMEPTKLVFMQTATSAVLALGYCAAFGKWFDFTSLTAAYTGVGTIIYLGVICTFACYQLQTRALQHVSAEKVTLITSTESLFATVFSLLLGYEAYTLNLGIGAGIITLSVIVMELKFKRRSSPELSPASLPRERKRDVALRKAA